MQRMQLVAFSGSSLNTYETFFVADAKIETLIRASDSQEPNSVQVQTAVVQDRKSDYPSCFCVVLTEINPVRMLNKAVKVVVVFQRWVVGALIHK